MKSLFTFAILIDILKIEGGGFMTWNEQRAHDLAMFALKNVSADEMLEVNFDNNEKYSREYKKSLELLNREFPENSK